MELPPTVTEIEQRLQEIRFPLVLKLHELLFLRDRLVERDRRLGDEPNPEFPGMLARLRRRIQDQQRILDAFPQTVYRTLVFFHPETGVTRAAALVSLKTARLAPFEIRGWIVHVLACSRLMHRCQVGDKIPLGLVVSTDGLPILSEAERTERLAALTAHQERRLSLRELRKLEAEQRRLNHERF